VNSYYTPEELATIGFASIGTDVLISKKASIYSAQRITIGNNVRIDDFVILSGQILIGNYVHIAPYSGIFAGEVGVEFNDFSGVSGNVMVYAVTDDYSGKFLVGPTVPDEFRKVTGKKIILNKHCHIGTGSVLLPGAILKEGASLGTMSMVYNRKLPEWSFCSGIPAKKVSDRDKEESLKLEKKLLK
jgi:galactoside O-acetyltransferase